MSTRKQINERLTYQEARALESTKDLNDLPKAALLYEKILKTHPLHVDANNRLMVLYRKLGESTKELKTIKNAIKSYQENIEKDKREWVKQNKVKAAASAKLAEVMGLTDPKGKPIYENEILTSWKTRLTLLQTRINKNKTTKAKIAEKQIAKRKRKTPSKALPSARASHK